MRVVRFLLLVMGMAATVAGCAQQPVAYMVYPPAGAQYPAAGIDHVVYGTGGPYVPPRPAVAYAPPPNPALGSGPNLPPSPAYVAAPAAAAPAPGPAYTMAPPAPAVAMAPQPAPPVAAPMAAPQMVAAPAPVASARPVRVASAVPVAAPVAVPAPPPATVAAPAQTALAAPAPVPAARPVRVASTVPIPVPIPPGPVAVPAGPVAYAPVVAPPDYTLDSGDRLRVVVFGQEGLTNAYLVDAAGCIDVPLIGQVLARGATTEELAYRIAAKLRNGFIREPHVAVEVVVYRPFFILGEVTAPGQYPYVPRMTAETAVAIAGGFTPRAFRRNLTVDRPVAGRIVRMSVPPSFPIRPGDTVNVQERWF
jgi:polysaccharide export outer membrane protein